MTFKNRKSHSQQSYNIISVTTLLSSSLPIYQDIYYSINIDIPLMSRGSMGDPEKFQLASIVTKNSRTGITSNRRLLVVKAGHLYYYSNIPKSFTGDNIKILEQFHELPKCSIQIQHINRVNGFEPTSSYFSIQFQAKHMLERQDIRRTLVNQDFNFTPRNTQEMVTWQFTCDNQFIKQRWVSALLHLKDYYKNQALNIQKYFDNIGHEEPKSSNGSISSRSSLKVSPWRESVASRKSYTLDNTKYGLELREGSPKEGSGRLQDPFLKKNRSEDQRTFQYPQFQMIIKEEQPKGKIEDAFKLHQVKKEEVKQQPQCKISTISIPPPSIEEVVEEPSITQTPIKENSYSDSQDHIQRRASMEKTLNDLKLFSQTHKLQYYSSGGDSQSAFKRTNTLKSPNTIIDNIVEQSSQPKNRKASAQLSSTPPSNRSSEEETARRQLKRQSQKGKERERQRERDRQQDLPLQVPPIQRERASTDRPKRDPPQYETRSSRQRLPQCDFEWLLGESCRGSAKFEYRLQRQKQLLSHYQSFKQKAINGISEWIASKARGENRFRSSQQGYLGSIVQAQGIQLRIGVLTTQNLLINGKPRIFFNQDAIKNLKRQFKIYQNITRMVMRRIKHDPALNIRPPLALYLEYKGVCCIAFDRSNMRQSAGIEEQQWLSERSVLQEQGYKTEWFSFFTLGGFLTLQAKLRGKGLQRDEQTLRDHLKRIVKIGTPDKNHNIVFQAPIDRAFLQCAVRQNASTSIQSMEKYIKGLRGTKGLQGTCPRDEIITALEHCLFCKHLRRVYRSAQGEIDETHFFNLVFKGDPAIAPLLEQSACPPLPKLNGQLFSFIEHYFGTILEVDEKALRQASKGTVPDKKKKDLFFSCSTSPILREYPFNQLQLVQSYSKLPAYLQTRHHLAEAALTRKKQIFHLCSETLAFSRALQLLYDQACFYYSQADFISCIKKCREYQQSCPQSYTRLFAVYLLMMKAYSQFSETDFSMTLKKATELIEYNYDPDHSSFIALYSLAAYYYSKLALKLPTPRQSALHLAANTFLKQAEHLCLRHFGKDSKQYLDVLLDLSRLHRRTDPTTAQDYLIRARQTCQQNIFLATVENIISLQAYQAELHLQSGSLAQAESAILSALALLPGKVSPGTRKHLAKLQYQLGFYLQKYQYCSEAAQKLWQQGERAQAVELAYRAATRSAGTEGEDLVDENDSVRFQGRERALMEIQQYKTQHGGLLDMVSAAIEARNTKLITMIHFLTRV